MDLLLKVFNSYYLIFNGPLNPFMRKVAQWKDLLSLSMQLKTLSELTVTFKSTGLPPMGTESLQASVGGSECLSHCLLSLCYVPVAYMHYHMTLLYVHEDDCYIHFPSNLWNFQLRTVYIIPILSHREEEN